MRYPCQVVGVNGPIVSPNILGVNLEMFRNFQQAMLSDRLSNSKFGGPEEAYTGIAPGWQPRGLHYPSVHYRLVPGMGMTGGEAQMIQNYSGSDRGAILQTDLACLADEWLEVELWAMARHHPVEVEVALTPLEVRQPAYDRKVIRVNAAYWKKYTVQLHCPREDQQAVFMISLLNQGVVYLDQAHLRPAGQAYVHPQVVEQIRALRLPFLRFPGGCSAANYHWRFGTGPVHLRPSLPDPVNKWRIQYDFGLDEYLQLCLDLQMQPYITVNIGTGTPEETGELAQYCAEWYARIHADLPQIYFQMGNEQYGAWEISHMTAEMYAAALQEYVPLIREHYPDSRIVVLGEEWSAGSGGHERTAWRKTLLASAAALFDVVTINRYKGQWFASDADQIVNAVESAGKVLADLEQLLQDCRHAGCSATVAVTEWNYWMSASHWDGRDFFEEDDAAHGLFVIRVIHGLARLAPDLELAAYYHLINGMGLIRHEQGRVYGTGVSHIFKWYRAALPGRWMDVRWLQHEPESKEEMSPVDISGFKNDEGCWLFISNASIHEAAVVEFSEQGQIIAVDGLRAMDAKQPYSETAVEWSGSTVSVPPLSLVRVRYREPKELSI